MTQEIDKEREAFEAAMIERGYGDMRKGESLGGEYINMHTHAAWLGWQASRASSVAPAGGVRDGKLLDRLLECAQTLGDTRAPVQVRADVVKRWLAELCKDLLDAGQQTDSSHLAASDAVEVPSVGQQGERATGGGSAQ